MILDSEIEAGANANVVHPKAVSLPCCKQNSLVILSSKQSPEIQKKKKIMKAFNRKWHLTEYKCYHKKENLIKCIKIIKLTF